ncbi:LuxR C-terminal-related transcriptional regulator [Alicyclobacillus tolerans]|uniref:helix-turn-helix transcriptional regulator n=1 Tax=Alicyclobacillus tolerans TaxID=90970 RepID=UPI001F004EE2|nr:LuxR C-terminal-related transcriptional regulator [Alicyclobacillus tolerans]MCF8566944.1 LuxR C-terminal-related transcriptional regulator [Alicyclobacillus tolerans]
MSRARSPSLPLVPKRALDAVVQQIHLNHLDCKTRLAARLASLKLNSDLQAGMEGLFSFLLNQFDLLVHGDSTVFKGFQTQVMKCQPPLTAGDIMVVLSNFEEVVMSVVWRDAQTLEAEAVFHWIHSTTRRLAEAALETGYVSIQPRTTNLEEMWQPPLARVLNSLVQNDRWQWMALVETKPSLEILTLVEYDAKRRKWHHVAQSEEWTQTVQKSLATSKPFTTQLSAKVTAVAEIEHDALSSFQFRQVAAWCKNALDFSHYHNQSTAEAQQASLYELLLDLDEALFAAKGVADVFSTMVNYVCKIANFERGALFMYSPLTKAVEGIYGHNIDLSEVMRIRESERSIPVLQHVMQLNQSMFYEDVSQALPDYYIRHFQLSSLLVCPIRTLDGKPVGVLLLDRAGRGFRPDERSILLVDRILSRASKALAGHIYESRTLSTPPALHGLTQREREILQAVSNGYETKEVASRLHISEYTVTEYVGSLMRKLQARNRTEAVAKGLREGIIH